MAKKTATQLIFANSPGLAARIQEWIGDSFAGRPYCIVCVSENKKPNDLCFGFDSIHGGPVFTRALIILEGLPIDLDGLGSWREWAVGKGALELHMTFLDKPMEESAFRAVIAKHCQHWIGSQPKREEPAISRHQFIRMSSGAKEKDDPSLLTMMFGSMGELLTAVDIVGRRFREGCFLKPDERQKYLEKIDRLLDGDTSSPNPPDLPVLERVDRLPRLLLWGETGVGKTLIARYLHKRTGFVGRPLRIPIPEYVGKEDMFEYDLFGYMRGAYTDAKEGSHGLLLENIGGVVFLDEIGEANDTIQAKLLAYLDDYRIRPRKWKGVPFYCPTLIVAATNRDLDDMARKKTFRGDLLARFTNRYEMPALRERMDDLPFILDCLLQSSSINPEGKIAQIGRETFDAIKKREFNGNFRELEDVLRAACENATKDGRSCLCVSDLSSERTASR